VVERSFVCNPCFRRLVRGDERRPTMLAGRCLVAFACLEIARAACVLYL
jgi:hypothetical protein